MSIQHSKIEKPGLYVVSPDKINWTISFVESGVSIPFPVWHCRLDEGTKDLPAAFTQPMLPGVVSAPEASRPKKKLGRPRQATVTPADTGGSRQSFMFYPANVTDIGKEVYLNHQPQLEKSKRNVTWHRALLLDIRVVSPPGSPSRNVFVTERGEFSAAYSIVRATPIVKQGESLFSEESIEDAEASSRRAKAHAVVKARAEATRLGKKSFMVGSSKHARIYVTEPLDKELASGFLLMELFKIFGQNSFQVNDVRSALRREDNDALRQYYACSGGKWALGKSIGAVFREVANRDMNGCSYRLIVQQVVDIRHRVYRVAPKDAVTTA